MDFKAVSLAKNGLKIRRSRQSKRNLAEQHRLVALWQSSGEKQRAFCRTHDLNPKTFSNWVRLVKENASTAINVAAESLPTNTGKVNMHCVEIILPRGVILRFYNGIERQQLSVLLQAVFQ